MAEGRAGRQVLIGSSGWGRGEAGLPGAGPRRQEGEEEGALGPRPPWPARPALCARSPRPVPMAAAPGFPAARARRRT